jgi:hypothetical protein
MIFTVLFFGCDFEPTIYCDSYEEHEELAFTINLESEPYVISWEGAQLSSLKVSGPILVGNDGTWNPMSSAIEDDYSVLDLNCKKRYEEGDEYSKIESPLFSCIPSGVPLTYINTMFSEKTLGELDFYEDLYGFQGGALVEKVSSGYDYMDVFIANREYTVEGKIIARVIEHHEDSLIVPGCWERIFLKGNFIAPEREGNQ